jgi:hypothetical protein
MNTDMQSLIGEMSVLIEKIRSGSATQGEIEAFTAAAAELHERAVVLRYKSYEAGIFARQKASAEQLEKTHETPVAEELVTTEAMVESHDPGISFSLFEEKPETGKASFEPEGFDLFSMAEELEDEQDLPDFDEEELPAEQEKADPGPVPAASEPEAPEPEIEIRNPDPIVKPTVAGEIKYTEEAPEDRPELANPDVTFSVPYDEILPKVKPEEPGGDIHPLYNRLKDEDDSLAARLMAVRLETLKGAFGFNERMQIVQELFHGDNEAFTEAIDTLDQLGSGMEARRKVTDYANRFNWDERNDLVMEFVRKVERRYA